MMTTVMNALAMGKYAWYVWPAYGLGLAVFLGHCFLVKRQRQRTETTLKQWFKSS